MSILFPENAITVHRGTSKTLELTVKDTTNAVVDITGSTVYFTVKRDIREGSPLLQKSSAHSDQIAVTAPRSGIAQIYLVPTDTQSLDVDSYIFDIMIILPTGKRYLVVPPSTLQILGGVTVVL